MNVSVFLVLVAAIGSFQPVVLPSSEAQADTIVQKLRQLPTPRTMRGSSEEHRLAIHSQLRDLDHEGVLALARALAHADVMLRRNALLALYDLGHGMGRTGRVAKVDILAAVPALMTAFRDPDVSVRAWSIQALGGAEPLPISAVPALIDSLRDPDTGVRLSACGALGQFGVAAAQAKASLERLFNDEHQDVRRCARFVLDKIAK